MINFSFGQSKKPKLVVGIVVDQMRYDYIDKYWDNLSENGFKKLVKKGFYYRNAQYNYMPTYTGPGHASIYTGTTPAVHGIIANDWFDKSNPTKPKGMYCTQDDSVKPIGTDNVRCSQSPRHLQSTTIGDELKLVSNGQSKVFGIALKDRGAILPAGRGGDAAYWFDNKSGNWVSSDYYKMNSLPLWVVEYNNKKEMMSYINKGWNTYYTDITKYTHSTKDNSEFEEPFVKGTSPVFPYNLSEIYKNDDDIIRKTPYGNTMTKDFAKSLITNEKLGEGTKTDMLCISFSSTDYVGHQFGINAIETEDTYIRLDLDMADLISFLEKKYGSDGFLLFLTADHAASYAINNYKAYNISTGMVDKERSIKTSMEMAWKKAFPQYEKINNLILSYSNEQVFFNHDVFKANGINPKEFSIFQREYLLTLKGINSVFLSDELMNKTLTHRLGVLVQNGYHSRMSGDMAIVYQPGYMDYRLKGTSHGSPFSYDTHVPLIFYGMGVTPGKSYEEVYITDIAPTVSAKLSISEPNGCTGKILKEVCK